jgi:hypothetical protein
MWPKFFQQDKQAYNFISIQRLRVENMKRAAHAQSSNRIFIRIEMRVSRQNSLTLTEN